MAPGPDYRQVGEPIRTAEGTLVVDGDGVTLDASPRGLVAGFRARWRGGERWAVAWTAVKNASRLALLASVASAAGVAEGTDVVSVLQATAAVALLGAVSYRATRTETIPASRLRRLELDADERELTVVHERDGGALDALRDDVAERSVRIAPGAVPDARAALRAAERALDYDVVVDDGGAGAGGDDVDGADDRVGSDDVDGADDRVGSDDVDGGGRDGEAALGEETAWKQASRDARRRTRAERGRE